MSHEVTLDATALRERASSGQDATTSYEDHAESELPYQQHMLAGAVAGIAEHLVMFPVDTIKTRMQALAHPGQRLYGFPLSLTVKAILKREGWRGLYGGFWAVAAGAGPAHAVYFAAYEMTKQQLGGNRPGHHPMIFACAGASATVMSDGIMTPIDVLKQRLQVARSPYKNVFDCYSRIMREEGPRAFFKSYKTTLLMNVPFTAVHFAVYETAKIFLRGHEEESLAVQLVAGGTAGAAAAAFTNPLDVVKTRLQLEGVNSATRYSTTAVMPTLKKIMRQEGSSALWRGVQARVLFHLPASAICWGTYETMKKVFHRFSTNGFE